MTKHVCGVCAYCERPAIFNGSHSRRTEVPLCEAHYMRRKRGQPMTPPIRPRYVDAWDRLAAASDARYAAETDDEASKANDRLRNAAIAYAMAVFKEHGRRRANPSVEMEAA